MQHPELTKPEVLLLTELKAATCGYVLHAHNNLVVRALVRKGYLEAMGAMPPESKVDRYRLTEKGREWDPRQIHVCPICAKGIQRFERHVTVKRDGRKVHAHAMCSREARSVFL